MMTSDEIWIDFKQGKLEAFYKNKYNKLLVYASRTLGPDYGFLAEDCVQDAVYKAYYQRHTFSGAQAFYAFFYTCIYHAAIDILRRNNARSHYLSQQEKDTEFLNSIIEQETLSLLYDAIENLPQKYRRIFDLSFEQGLKNAEIAALLGVTESAIKKQKATMLKLLREELHQKGKEDLLYLCLLLPYFYQNMPVQ